jgi:formate transporter FocA
MVSSADLLPRIAVPTQDNANPFDALLPPEMAQRAEEIGVRKAALPWGKQFLLGVLGGAFIAQGAIYSTVVSAGTASWPFGVSRLLAGVAFCLGLILVLVAGAELFTGNNLIVMAWASRRVTTGQLLRNWAIVYLGNLAGALATAVLMIAAKHYSFGNYRVGAQMLAIADSKCRLEFVQALALGVACNALVCLAVWLCMSARSTTDRILCVLFPISAFVAAGFEHSVANMYFVPLGLLVKEVAPPEFWDATSVTPGKLADLTWGRFLLWNLLPVTIGNVLGGGLMVGAVYWLVYLRKRAG